MKGRKIMKNTFAICSVSRQIESTSKRIDVLSMDIEQAENSNYGDLAEMYKELLLEELEQLQRLTLSITSLIAGMDESEASSDHTDEGEASVFVEGELTNTKDTEA